MICVSCFGNSRLGGFDINWSATNLETIYGVDPESVSCGGMDRWVGGGWMDGWMDEWVCACVVGNKIIVPFPVACKILKVC